MEEILKDFLKINDVKFKEDFLLKNISPIKIGGLASLVVYPQSEDVFVSLVQFLQKIKIRYKIIGRMSNILPRDESFSKVIIKTDLMRDVFINEEYIICSAGVSLSLLSKYAMSAELSGLEELSGIPGSLGGAILGNAGAFGREISDLVYSVRVYDPEINEIFYLNNKKCCFSYRKSIFQNSGLVILGATLKLSKANTSDILLKIENLRQMRIKTQPTNMPSLGSTFKRPFEGESAGRLIDMCSLRGFSIGGAQISEKHAGFIVNTGDATSRDYLSVMNYASERVFERFGIELIKEIEIL